MAPKGQAVGKSANPNKNANANPGKSSKNGKSSKTGSIVPGSASYAERKEKEFFERSKEKEEQKEEPKPWPFIVLDKDNLKLEMNNFVLRFPHLIEQILQKLDNKGLAKSREIARSWQDFIDRKRYSWLRIVNIPTILRTVYIYHTMNCNTYSYLAAKHGQIDMLKVILNSEMDLVKVDGFISLHVACHYGRVKIIEMLLKKSDELKIDLSRKNHLGNTAFHSACIGGSSELVELIMKNTHKLKIDLNDRNDYLTTGFDYACVRGHLDIVKMLIKNSKSMNIELNTIDIHYRNAFHYACTLNHLELAEIY